MSTRDYFLVSFAIRARIKSAGFTVICVESEI